MRPEGIFVPHLLFLALLHALENEEVDKDVLHGQQGSDCHDLVLIFKHVLLRVVKNVEEGVLLQLLLVLVTHVLQHDIRFTEQHVEEKTKYLRKEYSDLKPAVAHNVMVVVDVGHRPC